MVRYILYDQPKKRPKCSLPSPWKTKIKDSYSSPNPEFKSESFSSEEEAKLLRSLSKISDKLPVAELDGIYKAKKPTSPLLALNPASYLEGKIILYPRAFSQTENLTKIIVHELSHHLHQTSLEKKFLEYKKSVGWKDDEMRSGPFIVADSKDSPEEDFANNFEAYIFDPEQLEKIVPTAYKWMRQNLKNTFNLKDCEE